MSSMVDMSIDKVVEGAVRRDKGFVLAALTGVAVQLVQIVPVSTLCKIKDL